MSDRSVPIDATDVAELISWISWAHSVVATRYPDAGNDAERHREKLMAAFVDHVPLDEMDSIFSKAESRYSASEDDA